jgi:hypothetical protein
MLFLELNSPIFKKGKTPGNEDKNRVDIIIPGSKINENPNKAISLICSNPLILPFQN